MDRYKKNEAIKVNYIVIKKTTGLTDVLMHVYDEAGVELGSGLSPVAMTEIVGAGGLYYGSFTPDANGQWRIRIQSAVNGDDVQRVFEVGNYKLDDVKDQTQDIEDKVDIIDGNVDLVKTETDKIPSIKTETNKIQTIDDNVDTIIIDVAAVKVVVDSTETKVDNIKIQTQSIEDKIDDIDLQIDKGGYIL
jgi:hypothetical protein